MKKAMTRAELLRWIRNRYPSAKELGIKAKISTQSAYQFYTGRSVPRAATLAKLGIEIKYEVAE